MGCPLRWSLQLGDVAGLRLGGSEERAVRARAVRAGHPWVLSPLPPAPQALSVPGLLLPAERVWWH